MTSPLYASARPWLFLAMAPGVVGSIVILTPVSLAGLLLIVPGVCGFLGLIGLGMAWIGLAVPGIVARHGGGIVMLLIASLPATVVGLSILGISTGTTPVHSFDWMLGVGWASAAFGLLSMFFVASIAAGARASVKATKAWIAAGASIAFLGALPCAGYVLALSGYGTTIRSEQGAQAKMLATRAIRAVDAYRIVHDGALPVDNRTAGLPSPELLASRYVKSVTIDHGDVVVRFGEDRIALFFGAGASDVVMAFAPPATSDRREPDDDGRAWSCHVDGYRLEGDLPLLLDGRCST